MKQKFIVVAAFLLLAGFGAAASAQDMELNSISVTGNQYSWYTADGSVTVVADYVPAKDEFEQDIQIIEYLLLESFDDTVPDPTGQTWSPWAGFGFEDISAEGKATLYVWLRDAADNEAGPVSDWIVYSTAEPNIVDVGVTPADYSITVNWTTTDDEDYLTAAIGWLEYREAVVPPEEPGPWLVAGPSEYGFEHVIEVTGLLDETQYELMIHADAAVLDYGTVTTTAAEPTQDDVVWSGAVDTRWSYGRNWEGMHPPANPTDATLSLPIEGDSLVDPAEGDTWTVGAVNRRVAAADQLGVHTVDLDGNTLAVSNEIRIQDAFLEATSGEKSLHFKNGRLVVGAPGEGNAADIIMTGGEENVWTSAYVNMTFENIVLEPYIRDIILSNELSPGQMLNLDGITLATEAGGILSARDILMYGGGRGTQNAILMDDDTGISTLAVSRTMRIGGDTTRDATIRIGYPDPEDGGRWKLPAGMNLNIGDEFGEQRGNLLVGAQRRLNGINAELTLNGGNFNAFLTNLEVGVDDAWGHAAYNQAATGLLDLTNTATFALNATNVRIGTTGTVLQAYARGTVLLPEGTAGATNVDIGQLSHAHADGYGYLELNGTKFQITGPLTIRKGGEIIINVADEPSGLDLAATASLTMTDADDFNRILINFNELPADSETVHYGLRWAGNHASTLGALRVAGKLDWNIDESIDEMKVVIHVDEQYTYIALVDETEELPPVAVAADMTTMLVDGEATITPLDIDAGSYDQDGEPLTYKLSYEEFVEVDELTFAEVGEYEVTLIVINPAGAKGYATATVSIISEEAWRSMDLVWSGDDPEGNEWSRSGNWLLAGSPLLLPVPNPSTATFTFPKAGESIVDPDEGNTWTVANIVRYVSKAAEEGEHVINLASNTLAITNELRQSHTEGTAGNTTMLIKTGKLRIGTPEQAGNIEFPNTVARGDFYFNSTLKLADDVVFEPYLNNVMMRLQSANIVAIDLRGVQLAPEMQGKLSVNNLELRAGGWNWGLRNVYVRMNDDTGISTLAIADRLSIAASPVTDGDGYSAIARIGDETTGWMLPSGMNVVVGNADASQRGNIRIGCAIGASLMNGQLTINGGGFDAFVNELYVAGYAESPHASASWYSTGLLDLSTAADFSLDATDMRIGRADDGRPYATGTVYLPAGTAKVANLRVADQRTTTTGYLQLNGTDFEVTGMLSVQQGGEIAVNVGTASCGIDLPDGTSYWDEGLQETVYVPFPLTFEDDGIIRVNFNATPATSATHYGLRWKGAVENTSDVLATLVQDGHLDVNIAQAILDEDPNAYWEIQHDGTYAYVALVAQAPDVSTYAFSSDLPANVIVGSDADLTLTIATDTLGDLGYDDVRISFNAAGPGDVTFTSGEYSAVNTGVLPDELVLPPDASETFDITLNVSQCGVYTITFRCYDAGNEAITIAEDTIEVNVSVYGDAARDGVVDLLDLVFVRNRLFAEAPEGDDSRADIDNSGLVDLNDLIEVRNNLGSACE